MRHDRHDRDASALRDPHKARALAEHDAIAESAVTVCFEIAAWVDEYLSSGREDANGVFGTRSDSSEGLEEPSQRLELTHREVVRERIERRACPNDLPQGSQRAEEIGAENAPIVIRNEDCRIAWNVLESIAT